MNRQFWFGILLGITLMVGGLYLATNYMGDRGASAGGPAVGNTPTTTVSSSSSSSSSSASTSTAASTETATTDNTVCSNQAVPLDWNPAVHPTGWTFDADHSFVVHVWSNFRPKNLNPQNFPSPDGKQTSQQEFILFVDYGQGASLPPGTGGESWQFDCHNQGWADYNMQMVTEGFIPLTVNQIWCYYNTGNPWGCGGNSSTSTSTQTAQTCQADSVGQPINHPAVKGQTWTLPGNVAYVIHIWSNQWPKNLNPQNFPDNGTSKQQEFLFVTSIGPDVVLPVGTGGKAYPYQCNSAAQADYQNQMSRDGYVPIAWQQLVNYSLTGKLN